VADAGEHIAERIIQSHDRLSLPARLDQAWNQALVAQFTQRDTRHAELAVECARPPRHQATIADAVAGRIARQRGKLELSAKTLVHRLGLIHDDGLERTALGGEAGHHLPTLLVLLD